MKWYTSAVSMQLHEGAGKVAAFTHDLTGHEGCPIVRLGSWPE